RGRHRGLRWGTVSAAWVMWPLSLGPVQLLERAWLRGLLERAWLPGRVRQRWRWRRTRSGCAGGRGRLRTWRRRSSRSRPCTGRWRWLALLQGLLELLERVWLPGRLEQTWRRVRQRWRRRRTRSGCPGDRG